MESEPILPPIRKPFLAKLSILTTFTPLLWAVLISGCPPLASAQATPAAAVAAPIAPSPAAPAPAGVTPAQLAMQDALSAIQPLLPQINTALSSVDVHRWKAPGDVRDTTTADIQSIQRDLSGTLPALLTQAQGMPGAIAPAFAVYRNLDALYDVLLRVTETATLAGSTSEAARLESVRGQLQARRAQLGNALLTSATAQDGDVVQLRTSLQATARPAAPPAAPKKIVVDDGPAATPPKTPRRRKPATATLPPTQQ